MSQLAIGFDYDSLEGSSRAIVETARDRIKFLERRTSEGLLEIGRHLIAVREEIPGQFREWTSIEFGWGRSTAYNIIQVTERFGERVQNLDIAPSALYALASGTVPEDIREHFIERAEAGERVTHAEVKAAIAPPAPPVAEGAWSLIHAPEPYEWAGVPVNDTDPTPEPTPFPEQPRYTPEEQANVNAFTAAFVRAEVPHVYADDLAKAVAAVERHLLPIQRLPDGRLTELADGNDDLTKQLQIALETWTRLAAICRRGLGETGTLRRIG